MGIFVADPLRVRQLRRRQRRQRPLVALLFRHLGVDPQGLLYLRPNFHQGVHAALGLLKHHADLRSLNLPQNGPVRVEQFLPVQQDAAGIVALLPGQQTRHAHGGDGFSGAGFTHQTQDFAVLNGQAHTADRFPVPVMKFHMQILNFQHQTSPPPRRCSPSPISPTPNTIHTRVRPVPSAYQGALMNMP